MPQLNMPENWEPPVDAWMADFPANITDVVFGYFACQGAPGADISAFEDWWSSSSMGSTGPAFATRAFVRDAAGKENHVFIAYWPGQAAHDAWWASAKTWWLDDARLTGETGLWREVYTVPTERFETLFSSRTQTGAATVSGCPFADPIKEHAYWGGMRDRVAASAHEDFKSGQPHLEDMPLKTTRGARVAVKVPHNMCIIRSGQDLRECAGDERAAYEDIVHPNLVAGMAFLRDNPGETNCMSCHLMDEVTLGGDAAEQSFGLCHFLDMGHLEAWAHSHPTHLSIFNSFFEMAGSRGEAGLDLRLWHEVMVIDGDNAVAEYTNCHPRTGLLPWCEAI